MLKSRKLVFLPRKTVQNIHSPDSHRKREQRAQLMIKIANNNQTYIFINKSKCTDNSQHHFFVPWHRAQRQLQTKQSQIRIYTKKLWKQFVGSRQNINMHNPQLSPNLKQPPTLASLNYPDDKPFLKSFTYHLSRCSQTTTLPLTI